MPITSRSTLSAARLSTRPPRHTTRYRLGTLLPRSPTRSKRAPSAPLSVPQEPHARPLSVCACLSLSVLFLSLCGVPEDSRPRHTLLSPRYHTLSRHTLTQSAIGLDSRHRLTHHHLFSSSLPRYASSPGTYASTRLHPSTSPLSSSRARHSSGLATRTNTICLLPFPCDAPPPPSSLPLRCLYGGCSK